MTADEMVANVTHATTPEPGQLVEARRRQWIVSEVEGGSVAPGLPKRHLVRLASIDEDALGEEMGSGAFLVQACRWLSDRLVEA